MYAYLIAAVVAAAMLAGGAYKVYQAGGNSVRAENTARDLKAAQDYAQKEREITDAYRKKEASWASASAAVSKKYQKELANVHTQRLADLAAVDARTLRLRDPGPADNEACRGQAASTASSAGGNHDNAGTKLQAETAGMVLSKESTKFLIELTTEADLVVTQLSACQQILIDERK